MKQKRVKKNHEGLQGLTYGAMSSVIIVSAPRENAMKVVNQVFDIAAVQTATVGGLRMSPHVYNTEDHVEAVAVRFAL